VKPLFSTVTESDMSKSIKWAKKTPNAVSAQIQTARTTFERWWADEGSSMHPLAGEATAEYAKRITEIAWINGAYLLEVFNENNEFLNDALNEVLKELIAAGYTKEQLGAARAMKAAPAKGES